MATKPGRCEHLAASFQRGIQQVEDAVDCRWVDDTITALGLNNLEVAARIQKTESAISRWRNGQRGVHNKAVLFVTFVQLKRPDQDVKPYEATLAELVVGGYLQSLNDARDGVRRKRSDADGLLDTVRFFRLQVMCDAQGWYDALTTHDPHRARDAAAAIGRAADERAKPIRHRHPQFLAPPPPVTAAALTALMLEWREAWQQVFDCVPRVPGVTAP